MPRTLRLSFLACAITYCAAFWCAAAQAETRYQSVCFELHKSGSFFSKTIKEGLGSNEGKFVLKAICTYLTGNKPACSSSVDAAGEVYNRLTKHRGSDFYGMIAASPGYQVCRAFFVTSDWSATTDTDANMLIHSSRDKLTWYAAIGGGGSKGRWVRYQLVFEETPKSSPLPSNCHRPGLLWETHDRVRQPKQQNVTISLPKCENWCTGQYSSTWRRECFR
jgi:hypothetical protein